VILIVVPVLNRPQNAEKVAASLHAATTLPYRLVFVCSPGDTEQIAAVDATGSDYIVTPWKPGHADFARKVNLAYRLTDEPWIFQAADDVRFEAGWDEALMACHERTGALVIGTQDGGNPAVKRGQHSTHTLIARSYADDPGASMDGTATVFSEAYGHQMCDVELVQVAMARKVWAFCDEARVIHEHPFWDRAVAQDDTYRRGLESTRLDQGVFARRGAMWKRIRA
jgi:glycosyltransferase involved in cell wall biosynthesis